MHQEWHSSLLSKEERHPVRCRELGNIKKKTSAKTTPRSKEIAARKPLVMLVSISTKNTGPKTKLKKNPIDIAVKRSVSI